MKNKKPMATFKTEKSNEFPFNILNALTVTGFGVFFGFVFMICLT